jgi:flagellar hook-basal body complex protein FliE
MIKTIIKGAKIGVGAAVGMFVFVTTTNVIVTVTKKFSQSLRNKLEKTENTLKAAEEKINNMEETKSFDSLGEVIDFLRNVGKDEDDLK